MRSLTRSLGFACFLTIQVVGIAQLYPYVHLHHIHDDHGARVVVSVHPIAVSEEFLDAEREDEHHHSVDHLALDCHLCQRLLKQLQRSADVIVYQPESPAPSNQQVTVRSVIDPAPLILSQSIAPADPRGPPAIV